MVCLEKWVKVFDNIKNVRQHSMRVLFIIDSLGVGGAERSTLDYCLYLKERNCAVKIICLRKSEEGVQDRAIISGIEVFFLRGRNMFSQLFEINTIYQTYHPQLVHSTLYKSRLRGKLHKLFFLKKYVLLESQVTMPFSPERIKQRRDSYIKILIHKIIESLLAMMTVNRIVAISDEVKSHLLKELYFIRDASVAVVYRGRLENSYINQRSVLRKAYAREFNYGEDAIVFIHVGRQDFPKNHLYLIDAFIGLQKMNVGGELVLLCIGRSGDMSEKINQRLSKAGQSNNIFFTGHRYDVEKLLAQSDVFVFPSLFEGLGGSVIEAKASSLPVIVSDIPVFRELLVENEEAFFVDLKDPYEFALKMKMLAENATLRRTMGATSLHSYKKKFSTDEVNSKMFNLYQQMLHENTSTGHE
jgi:glycosyltransferase involved in cell wall biosynthesis